jgi:shikimate kinase
MMGSGKTIVGRLLSELTGWPYLDNDELVLRLFGATPRRILAEDGEPRLREAELAALHAGLATPAPSIVAAAAGTILDEPARSRLRESGVVVWLRTSVDTLERRAAAGTHRPWIDTGDDAWLEAAARERLPLYAAVADVVIDTDTAAPAESARMVLEMVAAFPACAEAGRFAQPPA